jgi:hypothetical protein
LIVLIPAYGRKYNNEEEILKDFNANKDFRVYPRQTVTNKIDLLNINIHQVCLNFGKGYTIINF